MRTSRGAFALALALLLPVLAAAKTAPAANHDDQTRVEIAALLNQFLSPAQMASAANHDRFWADDLVYTGSSGAVRSKAEIMKSFESAPKPEPGATPEPAPVFTAEDVLVRPYGENMAALTFRLVETDPDGAVTNFRNSGTFLRRNGKWQAVTWQATRVPAATPDAKADQAAVAALDTQYQAAVKANDAATMDRILADDFVLVTGKGSSFTKADLLKAAQAREYTYEHQEDSNQTVRVWGDTAVVTALLWLKGMHGSDPFDYKLWFSDTYVRTPNGWRYAFGQASIRLPATP
jgi:ketosteroid isomerase-like protein